MIVNVKVKRRINNNVVLATDVGSKGLEGILIGKGIGFNVHPGDFINKDNIQNVYLPSKNYNITQMAAVLTDASNDDINLVIKIIQYIDSKIEKKINGGLFFGLLDHISFTLHRYYQGMNIKSPLEWEIKHFYPVIYKLGLDVVNIIDKEKNVKLPNSEAAFIALHVINNTENLTSVDETIDWIEVSRDVNKIISISSNNKIDQQSIAYQRFINHLRYLVLRLSSKERVKNNSTNPQMLKMIMTQYSNEYSISKKISDYLSKRYGSRISKDEQLYLTLHLIRLLN
ncbi:hypothetical protein DS832_02640 [Bombilactobacillus bombi]|uniref:PRD domain-containing protein n=1 Tax=Bombilactobacillus bombi TaxID=1303590 RepID=A0A417ZC52_9LACO|nr:hypothetical protein DS832_02640 [Bombilactobacillus bombi]